MTPAHRTADIHAELAGHVATVEVGPGDRVEAGDPVVLMESMKMEIPVLAEVAGTVSAVRVAPGDVVAGGALLVSVDPR